jgi:hypothetical protein
MKVKTWILVIFWVVIGCDTEPNKSEEELDGAIEVIDSESDTGPESDADTDADTDSDTDADTDSDTDTDTDSDTDSDTDTDTDTDTDADVPADGDSCNEADGRYCNDGSGTLSGFWYQDCVYYGGETFISPDCEHSGCCQMPSLCPTDDSRFECIDGDDGSKIADQCRAKGGSTRWDYLCGYESESSIGTIFIRYGGCCGPGVDAE